MRQVIGLFEVFGISSAYAQEVFKPTTRDEEIRYSLIKQSVSKFKGRYPCPYSPYKNGKKCGRRSLWSTAEMKGVTDDEVIRRLDEEIIREEYEADYLMEYVTKYKYKNGYNHYMGRRWYIFSREY